MIKHALVLALAAAAALSFALALHFAAREKIEENRRAHESRLLKETLSETRHDLLRAAELSSLKDVPESVLAAWKVIDRGQAAAAAVRARAEGYGGGIVFAASFDLRGRLLQTRIVRHSETPGIADFLSRPGGGARAIDGVSGATVTSRAVARTANQIGAWIRYNPEQWRSW